jgi:hypothetical protein
MTPRLGGSFYVLLLYDVADEINLSALAKIIAAEPARREPAFKHPAPDYVRFERPPLVEAADPIVLQTGESFECRVKYFDYGVVCVELKLHFDSDWDELVRLSSRWIAAPDLEKCAAELIDRRVEKISAALTNRYRSFLSEDYCIIQLARAPDEEGRPLEAAQMVQQHGAQLTQIIRGESKPLAESQTRDALEKSLSYYPNDLFVAGWVAALIYDTEDGAAPAIQLLEYANAQLLEFRHYDDLLTRVLAQVYDQLEHKGGGIFRRWRMARQAERLNAMRLEVTEIAERADNAIKFLSDMFYARAYRIAAARIGVNDYRDLVDEKLRIAGELYRSMVDEFHQARAFVLELMVVAILVIELIHLFRGGI